ncbi:MAG: hypothetical protein OSB62_01975 [Alphaproteobacteria bacterium]|nr:hypothetical protein [Alphaproteobacteria bacterium]
MSSVNTKISKDKGPELDDFIAQRKRMSVITAIALGIMVALIATAGIWLS